MSVRCLLRPLILPACLLIQKNPLQNTGHQDPVYSKLHLVTMATGGESGNQLTKAIFQNGRFQNPWPNYKSHTGRDLFSLMRSKDYSKIPSKQELDKTLPVLTPDFKEFDVSPLGMRVMWIGHASVLVQFDNVTVLTDPIFSQYCSPIQVAGPRRYRDPPCSVEDLPKVDAVVISHNHYDHLDVNSVKKLNKKFGDSLTWFVPMGLASWMRDCGCTSVVELSWWETASIPGKPDVKFVATPSKHWCNRGLLDNNKVLWASWAVIGPQHRFFFGGDTGYCKGFEEIGREYGPFDLSAIPIGAYYPRWFMESIHVCPEEAVKIHQDVRSKASLGIHWGTFKMTNEFYLEPKSRLEEAVQKENMSPASFFTLKHGEIRVIGADTYNDVD